MRKERIFMVVFGLLFVTYVTVDLLSPKEINWFASFRTNDKNPFGAFILNERSADIFDGGFDFSFRTLADIGEEQDNILVLAEYADFSGADITKSLEVIERGGSIMIGATSFNFQFADTLGFETNFQYQLINQNIFEAAESKLYLDDSAEYSYPASLILNNFELGPDHDWDILASSEENPVAITKMIGSGRITLVSTPHIFTNFGLLHNGNYQAAARILSFLPRQNVHYTMYYQSGRREASTPLRYFLREDALRWSLYLGLFVVATFLIISSRRTQRPIPVITPPSNTTVSYIKTLGALFYRERNHQKAALKLIHHFMSEVQDKYFMQVDFSEKFYRNFAAKSGVELEEVIKTFELVNGVRKQTQIKEETLIELSRKIEMFK